MTKEHLNQYAEKLNVEIMKCYLEGFANDRENKSWPFNCQKLLRDFVLSRPGWERSKDFDGVLVFKGHYPMEVNILYAGSTAALMIGTAVGIAKAEWLDYLMERGNASPEEVIDEIVECIESQDWTIPFVRRKNSPKREVSTIK